MGVNYSRVRKAETWNTRNARTPDGIFHRSHHELALTTENEDQTMRHRDRKPRLKQEVAEITEVEPEGSGGIFREVIMSWRSPPGMKTG